ncbi:hypothetical protein C8R47DRAFT_1065869 [Mycena vitilis]|nr:hypothetical protein C8R47DRAFT_1065869 [Mycena vitilis]
MAVARFQAALARGNLKPGQNVWPWLGLAWLFGRILTATGTRYLTSKKGLESPRMRFQGHLTPSTEVYCRKQRNGSSQEIFEGCPKAMAFWLGFDLKYIGARPKAMPGQNFGLALALVPGSLASGF